MEFINAESKSIKYKSETMEQINKIIMDIKNSDAALVDLINEIGLKKNDNDKMMYQWISFLEAFTQCKYMTEEEYEEKWRHLLCNYSPMSDFDKLCNDYTVQYGSV